MNVLVLTTDLPFFPGKMGLDFFNLRYLSQNHSLGVIGPLHSFFPAEGIANLEQVLAKAYFWPRPATPATLPPQSILPGGLANWINNLSFALREKLLLRLLSLAGQTAAAYAQLAVLSNCAPHFLAALNDQPWQIIIIIQSNTACWLDYLPGHLAKLTYFHDVRSHLAARQAALAIEGGRDVRADGAIVREERRICREAEVAAFVSELDEQRALEILRPLCPTGIAPIAVDTDYYVPPPAHWRKNERPTVLFTGHLSHPPNVDAVLYFLDEIWPVIAERCPEAIFQAVGCAPTERLIAACAAAGPSVELHADVPDIRPYFWSASVYVVPMRFGGGVRQKIFEAWLMRIPVVCTSMAAEATRAEHGRNCWLEDVPMAFAERAAALLKEGAPSSVLEHASQTVHAHNSIPSAAGQFERLVHRSAQIKRQRPYKVLFDLRWMEIGKAGGIEQLAYEQLDAIAKLDHRNAYRILCPRSTFSEWNFPRGFQCESFFTDKNDRRAEALRAAVVNRLAETVKRPPLFTPEIRALRHYKKLDFDLVHSVNSYIHPDLAGFPQVLTMCDLQHLEFPDFFSRDDLRVREQLYSESCARARHIICISEFTRQDVHRRYGVPLEKSSTIWVIPSRSAWIKVDPAHVCRLLTRMGLESGRFLFYPAHPWRHKNHLRLMKALALVSKELPRGVRLVLTGRRMEPDHPARKAMLEGGLEKRVVELGYRSALEIRALYSGALALVFPSLFEGFGMPVAEALIAGCPVTCSNTSSLPEIAGNAALTFDPASVPELATALLRISSDASLRHDLVGAGEARRPLFSSRPQAVKTLAIYRRVFDEFYADRSSE